MAPACVDRGCCTARAPLGGAAAEAVYRCDGGRCDLQRLDRRDWRPDDADVAVTVAAAALDRADFVGEDPGRTARVRRMSGPGRCRAGRPRRAGPPGT